MIMEKLIEKLRRYGLVIGGLIVVALAAVWAFARALPRSITRTVRVPKSEVDHEEAYHAERRDPGPTGDAGDHDPRRLSRRINEFLDRRKGGK